MRELIYECKEPFKGEIKVEVLKFKQRLKYLKASGLAVNSEGEIDPNSDQLDASIKMIEMAEPHIKEVNVEHESGVKAGSYEELEDNPEFDSLISDIASFVFNAGQVGKSSSPS